MQQTGSNDLTQLTLGVDRDSGVLTGFDERDDAVKALMGMAIDAANAAHKYVGICGQAPSDFPELAAWLVARGIRSLSLNPDSVLAALAAAAAAEEQQGGGQQQGGEAAARTEE
jgi:pyruvate,water dikinase